MSEPTETTQTACVRWAELGQSVAGLRTEPDLKLSQTHSPWVFVVVQRAKPPAHGTQERRGVGL